MVALVRRLVAHDLDLASESEELVASRYFEELVPKELVAKEFVAMELVASRKSEELVAFHKPELAAVGKPLATDLTALVLRLIAWVPQELVDIMAHQGIQPELVGIVALQGIQPELVGIVAPQGIQPALVEES